MKKKLVTVFILLFTAVAVSYAGLYKSKSVTQETEEHSSGALYKNSSGNGLSSDDPGGSLFKSSALTSPGDRPSSGGGIGQSDTEEAPLGDGMYMLISCCVVFAVIKIVVKIIKNKSV